MDNDINKNFYQNDDVPQEKALITFRFRKIHNYKVDHR